MFFWLCSSVCKHLFLCLYWGLAVHLGSLSCGTWNLVPLPGIEHRPPGVGAQNLSRWTTREFWFSFIRRVPQPFFLLFQYIVFGLVVSLRLGPVSGGNTACLMLCPFPPVTKEGRAKKRQPLPYRRKPTDTVKQLRNNKITIWQGVTDLRRIIGRKAQLHCDEPWWPQL